MPYMPLNRAKHPPKEWPKEYNVGNDTCYKNIHTDVKHHTIGRAERNRILPVRFRRTEHHMHKSRRRRTAKPTMGSGMQVVGTDLSAPQSGRTAPGTTPDGNLRDAGIPVLPSSIEDETGPSTVLAPCRLDRLASAGPHAKGAEDP